MSEFLWVKFQTCSHFSSGSREADASCEPKSENDGKTSAEAPVGSKQKPPVTTQAAPDQ